MKAKVGKVSSMDSIRSNASDMIVESPSGHSPLPPASAPTARLPSYTQTCLELCQAALPVPPAIELTSSQTASASGVPSAYLPNAIPPTLEAFQRPWPQPARASLPAVPEPLPPPTCAANPSRRSASAQFADRGRPAALQPPSTVSETKQPWSLRKEDTVPPT
uniref:Uncharacterized protein n=1 Tax=Sphaerodactylus townsendi TaxID=933632 RepID=A0ACB8F6F3_9SAUR